MNTNNIGYYENLNIDDLDNENQKSIGTFINPTSDELDTIRDNIEQYDLPDWMAQRYTILIKPGTYQIDNPFKVDFYTKVLGLGENPDDVNIQGNLYSVPTWSTSRSCGDTASSTEYASTCVCDSNNNFPYWSKDDTGNLVMADSLIGSLNNFWRIFSRFNIWKS